jgi:hypothetical protein
VHSILHFHAHSKGKHVNEAGLVISYYGLHAISLSPAWWLIWQSCRARRVLYGRPRLETTPCIKIQGISGISSIHGPQDKQNKTI